MFRIKLLQKFRRWLDRWSVLLQISICRWSPWTTTKRTGSPSWWCDACLTPSLGKKSRFLASRSRRTPVTRGSHPRWGFFSWVNLFRTGSVWTGKTVISTYGSHVKCFGMDILSESSRKSDNRVASNRHVDLLVNGFVFRLPKRAGVRVQGSSGGAGTGPSVRPAGEAAANVCGVRLHVWSQQR